MRQIAEMAGWTIRTVLLATNSAKFGRIGKTQKSTAVV